MKLKVLETLVEVHDSPSFQEAARRLKISQASISNHIRTLEEELGVELFDRSVRPPAITLAGRSIIESAREILILSEKIRATTASFAHPPKALHLGVIPTATARLMPNCLANLSKVAAPPAITLETGLSSSLIEGVQEGTLDAAVITQPDHFPGSLRCELIYRERLAIVAKSRSKTRVTLKGLSELPFLRFDRRFGIGEIIDKFLHRRSLVTHDIMQLDTVDAILAMVVKGIGVSIVPERAIAAHHRSYLDVVAIEDAEATRKVCLIWPANTALGPQIAVLAQALKAAERE